VLGAVPAVFGSMQAMEAIKLIVGISRSPARDHLVLVDLLSLTTVHIRRSRSPQCPSCSGGQAPADPLEVESPERLREPLLVDIRELDEGPTVPGGVRMPMSAFDPSDPKIAGAGEVLLVCEHGVRSYVLASSLRSSGRSGFYSLSGGVSSLSVRP
jgi:adenylyltransferase/sulfurtransferase